MIVGKVNGVELIPCYGEMFNGGYGKRSQENFALSEGVGPLFGLLEDIGGEAHCDDVPAVCFL